MYKTELTEDGNRLPQATVTVTFFVDGSGVPPEEMFPFESLFAGSIKIDRVKSSFVSEPAERVQEFDETTGWKVPSDWMLDHPFSLTTLTASSASLASPVACKRSFCCTRPSLEEMRLV